MLQYTRCNNRGCPNIPQSQLSMFPLAPPGVPCHPYFHSQLTFSPSLAPLHTLTSRLILSNFAFIHWESYCTPASHYFYFPLTQIILTCEILYSGPIKVAKTHAMLVFKLQKWIFGYCGAAVGGDTSGDSVWPIVPGSHTAIPYHTMSNWCGR